MKTKVTIRSSGMIRWLALLACVALADHRLMAGETTTSSKETKAVEEETPEYKNWINLVLGGVAIYGDEAQFKQEHRISGDVFGGIEDMHYEHALGKDGLFSLDGRAIFDNDDYRIKLELSKPDLGYLRGGYTEFRSWYDGNGGYFPVNGQFFDPPFPEMELDRGEAWAELGLRIKNWPEITLHYSHQFRNGMKDSTVWGDTNLTGLPAMPTNQRKIAPAFRDIDETRDIFAAEISKNFGSTDVALSMRYEHSSVDNSLNLWRGAGQLPPVVPAPGANRFITQKDKVETDIFNGIGTTETRIKDNLWFTTGFSYTTSSSDLAGSRVIGTNYDVPFGSPILTLQGNDHQVVNLSGMGCVDEYLANLNLLWQPTKNLTLITAFRYTHEFAEADAIFLDYNTTANTAPFSPTNPQGGFHVTPPTIRSASSQAEFDKFAETFELRYDGLANVLFYARGDWEQEDGNIQENEISGVNNQGLLDKDASLFAQKYSIGANWYPLPYLNFATQYYYRSLDYDNDFNSELATPPFPGSERNQRLLGRDIETNDFNIRMTLRPHIPAALGNVSFVARYDYMHTTYDTQWAVSPTQTGSGLTGTIYQPRQSGVLTDSRFTGTLTWNPTARLYLQGIGTYVRNKTNTPADYPLVPGNTAITIEDFSNNYWTAGGSIGFLLDDKTDLHADYLYYRADNYTNNATVAVPYGMGAREHTFSASVSREITKNVRLLLKYSYFDYTDQTSGGHNNYSAHSVYSGLQFRF